ncbi:MAG: glycosyltransferase [Candidatus Omnitrophica bacterium]|nr:glycosyltransferase [Candidatus Omnitrophota bacterium]MBU1134820.1 glycosyltransferase [Candidatus Omnitrophota bacterium]MBU1810567.1 glycosyltransferase [Candidatus Omnitrophota bacterium]
MREVAISVVIPVKNGQRYLDEVLKAIFSQEIKREFEVVIVDSGSTDRTLDIIGQYPVRFYQIKENEFNHGLTRNLGISKAQGKYIILLTADAIAYDQCWMRKLIEHLERDSRVAGSYSRQIPHKDSQPLSRIRVKNSLTFSKERRESQIKKKEDYFALSPEEKRRFCNFDNVSSCLRKEVWKKVPFPKTDFAEDLEWSKAVIEAGHKIIYEPESIVYHSHDFSLPEWYRKNRINYKTLYTLFGIEVINNFSQLIKFFFISTLWDIYYLCKDARGGKAILSNIWLIPLHSLWRALGHYRGVNEAKKR